MTKFSTLCIDKETGMEMIICCCTYNEACMFLESENADNRFGRLVGACSEGTRYTQIVFEEAQFVYDEDRGVLLRKE